LKLVLEPMRRTARPVAIASRQRFDMISSVPVRRCT
jgi:hypothetical protein